MGCGDSGEDVDTSRFVAGQIDVDPNFSVPLTGNEKLLVTVQSLDGRSLAVQSVSGLEFPLNFCITSGNMLPGISQLPEQFLLVCDMRATTDAGTPIASGSVGTASDPILLGSQELHIRLKEPAVGDEEKGIPPALASPAEPGPATTIQGTVSLAVALDNANKSPDVLYIIARTATGQLLAVFPPYRNPQFPMEYELTSSEVMMGRIAEGQEMILTGRLDRDGNAFSSSGDIEGESRRKPVRMGDTDVDIVLDQVVR
ncbi:MAG: hypothetical protein ABIH23_09645 [bacterium]